MDNKSPAIHEFKKVKLQPRLSRQLESPEPDVREVGYGRNVHGRVQHVANLRNLGGQNLWVSAKKSRKARSLDDPRRFAGKSATIGRVTPA